jgi:transcriptional regulator with XRE-family HTH domain
LAAPESIGSAEVDAREVGLRIARARHGAGWMTQKTLAELLCVCKRSVQAYEAGTTIPYRHLHRLADIFERPASWFLYGEEPADDSATAAERDEEIIKRLDAQTRVLKALTTQIGEVRSVLAALDARFANADGRREPGMTSGG